MQAVKVKEIMTTDLDCVSPELPLSSLAEFFNTSHHHGLPVCDALGNFVGIVTLQDLEKALSDPGIENLKVIDIATTGDLLVTYPEEVGMGGTPPLEHSRCWALAGARKQGQSQAGRSYSSQRYRARL